MFRTNFDAEAKLWSGISGPPLYNPKISVGHVLLHAMKSNPTKIAQISANNGVRLTYNELYTKSVRAAQNIQKLNYAKGDIFAIISRNNHELAPIVVALLSTGHPFNTLDPSFTQIEMTHMLSLTKPNVIFTEPETYAAVRLSLQEIGIDTKIYTFCGQIGDSTLAENLFVATGDESNFIPVEVDGENETAITVCSSGTTGLAKGVCMTHAALLDQLMRGYDMPSETVLLCFSTLYWQTGVVNLLLGTLISATRIITTEAFSPELLLRLIEQYEVTVLMTSSHHISMTVGNENLNHRNLSSVKCWIVGGSKVSHDSVLQLREYLQNGEINVVYGMSELAGTIAMNRPYRQADTVGSLIAGLQAKIIDENGQRVGIGENGEICLKPFYKFNGYFADPENSAALFDTEGFIQTGDIGHFDKDLLLHIVDRKKEFLKYCGYQISPAEVESVLTTCPNIISVCVVGIPDALAGDLPAAVIVRRPGSSISEREIDVMVVSKFADYKKLRGGVYFVDSLPTTPSGKILRREVKKLVADLFKMNVTK